METLDFGLGLGMAGFTVLFLDAEHDEKLFEAVDPAHEAGGVDHSVIGQGAGRDAVGGDGLGECGYNLLDGFTGTGVAG